MAKRKPLVVEDAGVKIKLRCRTNKYWQMKSLERVFAKDRLTKSAEKRLLEAYRQAECNVTRDMSKLYESAVKNGVVDKSKLRKLIPQGDVLRLKNAFKKFGVTADALPKSGQARLSRLEALHSQIRAEIARLSQSEAQINGNLAWDVYQDSYNRAAFQVAQGIGGTPAAFSTLNRRTIEAVIAKPWANGNFGDRAFANGDILGNNLQTIIGGGIASGQSYEKTVRQIREQFGIARNKALRLVRTESAHYEEEAAMDSYRSMGVEKYQFLATLDNRTSAVCQFMDGKVFPVSERAEGVNAPIMHVNCRSTTVPYLGKEFDSEVRIARDPETGKNYYVDAKNTFPEWKASLGVKTFAPDGKSRFSPSFLEQYNGYKKYIGKAMPSYQSFINMKIFGATEPQKKLYKDIRSYAILGKRGELPASLSFAKYRRNISDPPFGEQWRAAGFSQKERFDKRSSDMMRPEDRHYRDHVVKKLTEKAIKKNESMGDIDKNTYLRNARLLFNDERAERFIGAHGNLYVYKEDTNEFAVYRRSGIINTYYKPSGGLAYWDNQKRRYGQ